MDALQTIMAKLSLGMSFEPMSPREYEQFKVDGLNASEGNLNERDDHNCPDCKNKGFIIRLKEDEAGNFTQVCSECKCMDIRRSILRMRRSGLKDIIKDYTFDKFVATEPWQKTIKEAAMEYAEHPVGWFFLGGQSGAGKSHLCTAICRKFLLEGRRVQYMLWRDDIVKIKNAAMDGGEELGMMLDRLKTVEVLYIDDLFKVGKAPDGKTQRPNSTDVNYAFEIINYRYNNPKLLTIISSEWSEAELLDIDEATAGRIYERAKTFSISKDRSRNYRIKRTVTL